MMSTIEKPAIVDKFGREHDYLRISLTDKCNFRCLYCMPVEDMTFAPSSQLMSADEIIAIAGTFVDLGVKKIRLTGGEPLVRKDAREIINRLGQMPVELSLTTNAYLVDQYIDTFKKVNISAINVSLDTLKEDRFQQMTKRGYFKKTFKNIQLLLSEGFKVKINAVVIRGMNDDEVNDFVELTTKENLQVRFIEFMPFSGNQWKKDTIVPFSEMLTTIENKYSIQKLKDGKNDTSKNFKVEGAKGSFAFISTVTAPFCAGCNRIRLTADGKVKNCLFSNEENDLLGILRQGGNIRKHIFDCFKKKHFSKAGMENFEDEQSRQQFESGRSMISIGG